MLCLAFPVHPPGRPEKTRLAELDAVTVPVLVVQGERDPFGMPPDAPGRTVARVNGDHGLKADRAAIAAAIGGWLARCRLTRPRDRTGAATRRPGRSGAPGLRCTPTA